MSPPGPEVDNVRNCLLGDQIELDGAEAEYGLLTHNSPTLLLAYENNEPHLDSLRLEVPAIREPSSPNAENAIDILAEHAVGVQGASDAIDNGDGKIESFFEDALIETLNAHRSMANAIVEQEKYDPVDSFARVRVPVMDFRLPRPDWEANGSDPKSQFSHMILDSLAPMLLPTSLTSTSLDAKLKWVPIAHDSGHFRVAEQLGTLSTESQALLDSNSVRINTSSSHIRQSAKPAIFELYSDDYIECEHVCESQDVVSPFFIATSPTTETLPEVQPITSTGPSLMDLVRNKRQGMMADNTASPIEEGQIMNTGKLLSNFMELRSIKRPRLSSRILNTGSIELRTPGQSASSQPSSAVGPSEIVQQAVKEPSPAPKAQIPDEKAKYIVSVDLARSILSYLETVWPPENLIDRQFSDQRNIGFLSTESNQVEGPGQLSFEADITLTVGVGLITTSMPKARQRPLPGSDKLPQLRGRVVELSTKYEKLIVLISEVNPSGEFVGELSAFDLAAYTDFVRFTIGLDASISTYLVPGTYDTMARWVLAFICRYSLAALRTSRYLSAPETTWELFFRHAGMNVAAAQVLSSVLFEQAGDRGLAHFLAMSPKERLSRYSALLGGEKLLQRASQIIDQPWK